MVEVDKCVPGAQKVAQALKVCQHMRDKLVVGEVAESECELWKIRFTY